MKITPAHDFNDYEVGRRHALPMINILTFDGDIRESAEVFDTKGEESDVYSNEIPAEFQKLNALPRVKRWLPLSMRWVCWKKLNRTT